MLWTSGWLENQNKCWKGSNDPPLTGSKKLVLKWRSKIIIVIDPANTGIDNTNKNEVKNIDHGNNGKKSDEYKIERLHAFNNVTIKLIEPNNELNPATCKEKNIKSIEK